MKFPRQTIQPVEVNLTPLIDVVFLLLIFFMVSTTFTEETHLNIDLPRAETGENETLVDVVDITITAQGDYAINGQALINTQLATLKRAIEKVSGGNTQLPLVITADAQAPHQAVVSAMDAAGQAGFIHLSITTQEPQD